MQHAHWHMHHRLYMIILHFYTRRISATVQYVVLFRPLFGDFLFFIPAHMYFSSRTYFAIIKDLTIICMNKF